MERNEKAIFAEKIETRTHQNKKNENSLLNFEGTRKKSESKKNNDFRVTVTQIQRFLRRVDADDHDRIWAEKEEEKT